MGDDVPEPAPGHGKAQIGAGVQPPGEAAEGRVARIFRLKVGQGHALGMFALFGQDHFRRLRVAAQKHATAAAGQQQNAGQHQRRNIAQGFAVNNAAVQPPTPGRAQAGFRRVDAGTAQNAAQQQGHGDGTAQKTQQCAQGTGERRDMVRAFRNSFGQDVLISPSQETCCLAHARSIETPCPLPH